MLAEEFLARMADLYPSRIKRNEKLACYTTWRIGGPAELFFQPQNSQECAVAISLAKEYDIPVTFLGSGSNVLVSDQGIAGLIILTNLLKDADWQENRIRVGAGYSLPKLAQEVGQKGLTGLEFAAGIPGTVGGAVLMNAGAHGSEIAEVVEAVKVVSTQGILKDLPREQLGFSYRHSLLQNSGLLVTEVVLEFKPGDQRAIKEKMAANLAGRKQKQPLEYPNAGSVFKNPPHDAAGRLIEEAGAKGLTVGGAQISNKHANFIVNIGGATAKDVIQLIKEVQALVLERFGFFLETEVVMLGFDNNGR